MHRTPHSSSMQENIVVWRESDFCCRGMDVAPKRAGILHRAERISVTLEPLL